MNNIGVMHLKKGEFDKALPYFSKTKDILIRFYTQDYW